MRLDPLLCHRLGDPLGLAPLKLTRQQVAQPPLQQGDHAAQEEEPDAPHGGPDTHTRALADGSRVEPVVDKVLQILAHADLSHQAVLVTVHAGQLADVREDVLQAVGQLEGIYIAQPEGVKWC